MATPRTFLIAAVIVGVFIVAKVDSKQGGCSLFEYYDPHMDNCGPCREICEHMEVKRTEEECKSQCPDYLVAVTCTYRQYYDDIVKACAPCSELCDHSDLKGTTQECAARCHTYLKAQNCTDEEYFEEEDMECAACSELCSQRDQHGNTSQACFHKCLKYTQKYSSLISDGDGDGARHAETKTGPGSNNKSLPSWSPAIMAAVIVIGLLIIGATIGLVKIYLVNRRPVYTPANSIEGNVDDDHPADDEATSTAIQMEDLSVEQQASLASGLTRGQAEGQPRAGIPAAVAVQEENPHASGGYCLHNHAPLLESCI